MSGKGSSLKGKAIYRKMLKNKHNSQSILHFSDQAVTTFYAIKEAKKELMKTLNQSRTKDKKTLKHMKNIYRILSKITLKEWKGYFGYGILEVYSERNNLIIKGKTIKR